MVGRFVGWLVGCLVVQVVGRFVGWLVGCLVKVGASVGRFVVGGVGGRVGLALQPTDRSTWLTGLVVEAAFVSFVDSNGLVEVHFKTFGHTIPA
jgi:hypothetical protein